MIQFSFQNFNLLEVEGLDYRIFYKPCSALYVYNNKSCTIQELADLFSNNQKIIGNRCEEKTDEALLTINELNHSKLIDNKYYVVGKELIGNYDKPLTSDNAERLTKEELKKLLDNWRNYENSSNEL